jgi:Flp pilus assembly protein TadB
MFIVGSDSAMVLQKAGDATRKSRDDSSQRGAHPVLNRDCQEFTLCFALSIARRSDMAEELSQARRRTPRTLKEALRIRGGNDAVSRVCMIGFGMAIAAITPVTWFWKIPLFLMIMFLVGTIMPAIWRARRNPH